VKEYTVNGLSASGTANKTAGNVIGSTAIRPLVNSLIFGILTDPNTTDQQARFQVGNTTAVGTAGSSPTPKPRDPQDVAAVCTAGITHSAEPTYGSTFHLDLAVNQRGSKEWGCADGKELAGAASANNGIGAKLASLTNAGQALIVIGWRE